MAAALQRDGQAPAAIIASIGARLRGFEIDPFGAWVSQVFAETVLMDVCRQAERRLPGLVKICDALAEEPPAAPFDLAVGNPPYGRINLSVAQRARYRRGLFGHANLYGLFTELAVGLVRPGGAIAYVTPTSFLSGEYFKALRALLVAEAPPVSVDFVASRRGVFEDVLQETLLTVYRRRGKRGAVRVHALQPLSGEALAVHEVGTVPLITESGEPWLLPRDREQAALADRLRQMPHRLRDYGYTVSTGQLVWNRHRDQLREQDGPGCYPLIWAEAISPDGRFLLKMEKRCRWPYVEPRDGQEWLLTRGPCVLVQRTTAKEQRRRLVAAELPLSLVRQHGAVVVENHLNIVRAIGGNPRVPAALLRALLTSEVVDQAFRCINGSVAVSAYEIESLPLPPPEALAPLREVIEQGGASGLVDLAVRRLFMETHRP
jgi:adenine-specific DNA-methyltransferase